MRVKELNMGIVASKLISVPLLANRAGNKWLKTTAKSYLNPDPDDLEGQFVRDLLLLDTETIIETWYGGQEGASDLFFKLKSGNYDTN